MSKSASKQQRRLFSIATLLLITTILLSIALSVFATRQQTRPQRDKFSTSDYQQSIHGHRPATSILPVKSLNFHHHENAPADDAKRNEFDRLNKAKNRRLTRMGLHDAVLTATRQSSDIVVMGATSLNQ
jgi:cell division protein FtsN